MWLPKRTATIPKLKTILRKKIAWNDVLFWRLLELMCKDILRIHSAEVRVG